MESARLRRAGEYGWQVAAAPETVFPLLCPVREYDWIDGWRAETLHPASGLAELDCVFTTAPLPDVGPEIWTCTRHEPPRRVDYVRVGRHTVMRLQLTLEPAGQETALAARLVVSALSPDGDAMVAGLGDNPAVRLWTPCFLMLDHFLRTGTRLPRDQALALSGQG